MSEQKELTIHQSKGTYYMSGKKGLPYVKAKWTDYKLGQKVPTICQGKRYLLYVIAAKLSK